MMPLQLNLTGHEAVLSHHSAASTISWKAVLILSSLQVKQFQNTYHKEIAHNYAYTGG